MNGFVPFSKKQLRVLTWWCPQSRDGYRDALICDGAVRSGKTLCMSLSFVFWAFWCFREGSFAICGKTVTSLKRNIITPLIPQLESLGFKCNMQQSRNILEISFEGRSNRFYLFGGRDESSAALIQGMTLCGVMLDEVALMPRSFVEQALARCSVEGSKFWFSCNPDNPSHWFYKTWIKKCEEKNALYLHFTMEDNPSLSKNMLKRYKSLYSGVFYERFVKGRWVAAQGLVYPFFSENKHCADELPDEYERYYVSCDYGTVNPCSMGLWGEHDGVWYRIDEYYWASRRQGTQKTDEEYCTALENLCGGRNVEAVVCDPSAASFMECIRRRGRFNVIPAKNDVVNGIRIVADMLRSGRMKIWCGCTDTLREFSLYRWDESQTSDRPVKENDHAMDDIRYFAATVGAFGGDDGFCAVAAKRARL